MSCELMIVVRHGESSTSSPRMQSSSSMYSTRRLRRLRFRYWKSAGSVWRHTYERWRTRSEYEQCQKETFGTGGLGSTTEFLQLSEEEARFLELKLALANGVRELRERRGLTQAVLAERLGSSQSRVAKMEAGDRSVSLDLMMRSLLSIGATATEIAKWIKRAETDRAA